MYFTDSDSKKNVITMGKVDGILDETTTDISNPNVHETSNGIVYNKVSPGQKLSKIPTVTVKTDSEDTYIRMKITITGLEDLDGYAKELEDGLDIQSEWNKGSDGSYYYNKKMSAGEITQAIFTTVTIPNKWSNEFAEHTFNINLQAELIQADNFTPVTEDGKIVSWGTVNIK